MLSLSKVKTTTFEKKQEKKINEELPYFITLLTLLSSAGIGPYFILERIKSIDLLPFISKEAQKMLKRIDLLGQDPLAVMNQAKEHSSSKALGDFFDGYVSTIQSGGDILNYLKTKMVTVFSRHTELQKQSVTQLGALIEAYMTVQVVLLAIYIISAVVVSDTITNYSESFDPDLILLVISPAISFLFIFIANKSSTINLPEIPIKKIMTFIVPGVTSSGVLIGLSILPDSRIEPYVLGIILIVSSIWPTLHFKKLYSKIIAGEVATPQILRTITEARKTGMSPESCVIHACKRKDYGLFNNMANGIANKIEWGVEFKNIFSDLKKEISNFNVLISFKILFELISSGGGNTQTLDSLAETSEKMYETQKNKRSLLKPYLYVGFILIGTTAFTTLLVADSFGSIAEKQDELSINPQDITIGLGFFPIIVLLQSWSAGLFLGKVITGAYSGGFQYSIILVIISLIGITLVQFSIIDVNSIF
ncbi:MAG: type II secretion system F family protein [Nitrosopumilaceae archaeon]|nr:type II secretion system F family protein [Nitrosopumilaceae archaeon]